MKKSLLSAQERGHLMLMVCSAILRKCALGPTPPYPEYLGSWVGYNETGQLTVEGLDIQCFRESDDITRRTYLLIASEYLRDESRAFHQGAVDAILPG